MMLDVQRGDIALLGFWGGLGRNRRIWLETSQPMRQKAIQGLLSRFRWSPGPSIFDGFLADLNQALSALFFKIGSQKSGNPGSPPVGGGPLSANPACAATSRGNFRIGELITESVSCKSFVEPQIIEICEKIHSQRDIKPGPGGNPPGMGLESLAEWVFSKIARLRGSSEAFRAQDSDTSIRFGVLKCVESVFGTSKNRKSENAQNRILDVRKFGPKVLKTTPGPSESNSP